MTIDPSAPLLVFSPHFDDAVLSLRGAIGARPGSIVATVCTRPVDDPTISTRWDAAAGFESSRASVLARTAEDLDALAVLGAEQELLGFFDGQYKMPREQDDIRDAMVASIEAHPDHLPIGPLGLAHRDHIATADAYIAAVLAKGARQCLIYEEIAYRLEWTDFVVERTKRLRDSGWSFEPVDLGSVDDETKEAALQCYPSQLPLFGEFDIRSPETVWQISR
jgi:LmbE family N-acetylglucosaminyl deacetylase